MSGLSENNIESELSYAYLHAVACRAGMNCRIGNRHDDNTGVDAVLTAYGPFEGTYHNSIDIKVQLKATQRNLSETDTHLSYSLEIKNYNELKDINHPNAHILVVLILDHDSNNWLVLSEEELIMKKCAYWLSLYGAEESKNETSQTIYLPRTQLLSVENLKKLALECAIDFPRSPKYINPKSL